MSLVSSARMPIKVMAINMGQRMSLRRTLLLSKHTQYRRVHGRSEHPLFARSKTPETFRKTNAQTGLATLECLWKIRQPRPAQSRMHCQRAYSTPLPLGIARAQERSALLQARRAAFNRKEKISRGHGMWINCVELLGLRQDSSTRIARSKLEVFRCEDEYRSSTGARKTLAALRVLRAKQDFQLEQILTPLNMQIWFMRDLSNALRHCPYNRLQKRSWCFLACAGDLRHDKGELILRRNTRTPYFWLGQYGASTLPGSPFRFQAWKAEDLMLAINQEIDFPSGPGSKTLRKTFKLFLGQYTACSRFVSQGSKAHHTIMLRSPSTSKQRLFNAFQHGFYTVRHTAKEIMSMSWRMSRQLRQKPVPLQAPRSRQAAALRNMRNDASTLSENWDTTMGLYVEEYVPVFSSLLDFMTPEEIERRSESLGNYWLRYWQRQKQKDDREARIETCLIKIRKALNELRGRNTKMLKLKGHWKRLDPANDAAQASWQHQRQKQRGYKKLGKHMR
ncbi:hypothetical protein HBH70_194230 [Parastagonospora nodorum]|nr:hypothetical protein HBH51_182570 [Parastagonospora nodorum]KAH3993440.1 hypothetical protein HBI10_202050 [Parastagonospora nodorum]KAH4011742.1 hypothetical protein HBI13_196190 [Parastagonospora nodorum]KAH4101318.1 hypothetical protein HBH46_141270 [Parastagonospora nodorum]KAH4203096.1 hypothetical protein HBI95_154240 [Parastagonospora nodorum]